MRVKKPHSADGWQQARAEFRAARRPLALTGAGISVESGIPDFRGDHGLWRRFEPEQYATLEVFRREPHKAWEMYRALGEVLQGKQPNPAHRALARLEREGRLQAVITQNIDGLHQLAGSRRVVEVHGEYRHLQCLRCGRMRPLREEDYAPPAVPACHDCGAPLKPNVVLFGEWVRHMDEVGPLLESCDALLVIGTSAEVYPVADLPRQVIGNGGRVFEFNVEETTLTSLADYSFRGPCGRTLPRFVA